MLIIGELINSTRKSIKKAIEERDAATIKDLALRQVEAGANWLDVNAGAFVNGEVEQLEWLITTVRQVTQSPLCIDSPRPAALERGLAMAGENPFTNSITAEKERYREVLPLVKKYHTNVVALSLDDNGMTDDMDQVYRVAEGLIKRLEDDGVPPQHIFIDPLVRPVSTNSEYGSGVLALLERITAGFPDVHKTCGLSNISYGLPKRKLINQTFMVMAIARGLDSAIIDPLDPRMMAEICAAEALIGRDVYCMEYIKADRAGKFEGVV